MSRVFGNTSVFGLEYILLENPHEETGVLKASWGQFKMWVDGKDICRYSYESELESYEWNLIYLVEWFCENLQYVVGYDPFPIPVEGLNMLELCKKTEEFTSEDEVEVYLWNKAYSSWLFRHNWLVNRDGSILPSVQFRRTGAEIEISWDNEFWKSDQIEFESMSGVYWIENDSFKSTVLEFLHSILEDLNSSLDNNLVNDHEQLIGLSKKIRFFSTLEALSRDGLIGQRG